MSERPLLWLAAGLALLSVTLLQTHTLLALFQSDQRLSDRVALETQAAVGRALERQRRVLENGVVAEWPRALARARRESGASELELFDAGGSRLLADPGPAPLEHWPTPEQLESARTSLLDTGPLGGPVPRLLHYSGLRAGGRVLWLRFATEVPELLESRRVRRQALLAHAAALAVLLVAAALVLLPSLNRGRAGRADLGAYEEAMAQLQSRGVQARAELARLGEELRDKAALARSGELAAGIAHEMRNGLGTILAQARLVESEGGEAAEAARAIREECDTLEAVIRRFVDFVREERLERRSFDLVRTLRRVVAREGRSHPVRELELSAPEGALLSGDEDLLERGFENLVRNALEAAGPLGRVEVELRLAAAELEIAVRDDGPGLGDAAEPLRPFASGKPGGLGLGLPLALKVVQLHEGSLELRERLPSGVEVTVRLPRGLDLDVTDRIGPGSV